MGKLPQNSIKDRLMAYPKEVLVDYFLECAVIWSLDWKRLDFKANQRQIKHLLDRSRQLIEQAQTAKGSKWLAIDEELDAIQRRIDRLNKAANKLLDLDGKVGNG